MPSAPLRGNQRPSRSCSSLVSLLRQHADSRTASAGNAGSHEANWNAQRLRRNGGEGLQHGERC